MSKQNVNYELEHSDVGLGLRVARIKLKAADFTDDAGTSGSYTWEDALPAWCFPVGTKVTVTGAFDEDTAAALKLGSSAGEDCYTNGTTVSVLAVATVGLEVEDALKMITSESDVHLTITGSSDFTLLAAGGGEMTVELFYLSTVPE